MGHSCLSLRSHDLTLVTDPYNDSVGLSIGSPKADIVTLSHDHPHHANNGGIAGDPRVLRGPGEYEIGNFYVTATGTRRSLDDNSSVNTVFSVAVEGLTICHVGDMIEPLSPRQVEQLRQTDILVVPVGGVCTLAVARVAEMVNLIGPRIVIPVHFKTEGISVELEPLDGFLRHMGIDRVDAQPRISVTASNLPLDLQVVPLQRANQSTQPQ